MAERLFAGAAEVARRGPRRGRARRASARAASRSSPRLSIRSESSWEDFKSPEVIAKLPGSDPRLAAEHVVLMGHLDHLGLSTTAKPGADAINNGALDNAAGVATMIEAARAFVASGKPPRRSVMFIANTAEELGLLGADYFAAHPTVPAASIVGRGRSRHAVADSTRSATSSPSAPSIRPSPPRSPTPGAAWGSRSRPTRCRRRRSSSARTITASSRAASPRSC